MRKKSGMVCEYKGHEMAIKGITALYSMNIHYFASVSKYRSIRVFGLNES